MNKQIFIGIAIFLISLQGFTQKNEKANELFQLTKKQMIEDFEYLKDNLKKIYPYYFAWEIISKDNITEQRHKIEHQLSKVKTNTQFYWLIYSYINIYPDNHLKIPHARSLGYYKKNQNRFDIAINRSLIDNHKKIYAQLHDSIFFNVKLGMRFKYINGHYYSLREFEHNHFIYPKGSELISINSIDVNDFVYQNKTTIPKILWDNKSRLYYSDNLLLTPAIAQKDKIKLKFKLPNQTFNQDVYNINETVKIITKQPQISDSPNVCLLNDSILYIRMPYMFNESYYSNKIDSLYNSNIKKIIWDIRNNRGGMDKAWKKVLSKLIKKPIAYDIKIGANNNKTILDHGKRNEYVEYKIFTDSILNYEFVNLASTKEIIQPDSTLKNIRCKIILLVNENSFSAANSLQNIGNKSEDIISIGYRSGWIGGRGLTPLLIQLPNSKLFVQIPFTIDCSYISNINDYLHNTPEVEVTYNIRDFLRYYYEPSPYSEQYLINQDLLLKKAMKL